MHRLLRVPLIVACVVLDVLVLVVYGVALVLGCADTGVGLHSYGTPHPTKPDIVLLHGSGADARQFLLARYLMRACRVHTINLSRDGDKSIQDYAKEVVGLLHTLDRDVVLVGVSMGGLIAVCATMEYERVRGVVTIGSPFGGAPALDLPGAAWLLPSERHKQMKRHSIFLASYLPMWAFHKAPLCPVLSFGSLADFHVPDEYSRPPVGDVQYHQHHTLVAPGHIALTVTPSIFRRTLAFYHTQCGK